MVTSSSQRPTLAQAFEPPQSPAAGATASQNASTSKRPPATATTSSSPVQFPPSRPRCPKCQPMLQHTHSTASVLTNHPAGSTSLVTPANHVSVRYYIGPLPVPGSAAKAIAKAILEDGSYTAPDAAPEDAAASDEDQRSQSETNQVNSVDYAGPSSAPPPKNGTSHTRSWTDPFGSSGPTGNQTSGQQRAISPPSSPNTVRKPKPLPIARPPTVTRDPSSASVVSNASFVSAQSPTRSVFSDSEAPLRGETAFDAATTSPSASPPASPSKRRFGLLSRRSNQSLAASVAAGVSLQPPTSILKSPPPGAPFARANTDIGDITSRDRNIGHVRSAEHLRVAALRQQRRIGSEGSRSAASSASLPNAAPSSLPLLDLPLDQIEEAINDPGSSRQVSPQTEKENADQSERRALNSSNETTIIRDSGKNQNDLSSPVSPPPRDDLLHPTWGQPDEPATFDTEPLARPNGSATLTDPLARTDTQDTQQSPSKPSRNLVGRGLPKKRSLTFSREPSMAHMSRNATSLAGIYLPRAVDHNREFSRQSRVSRASTAGTFNTVGTVATEGSFGATNASTLARRIFNVGSLRKAPKRTDSIQSRNVHLRMRPTRTDSIRDPLASSSPLSARTRKSASPFAVRSRRRPGRSTSYASMSRDASRGISAVGTEGSIDDSVSTTRARGVPPGAVGTSLGGTKWVGESFQVGKRFWDILQARREELQKSQPCTCGQARDSNSDNAEAGPSEADKKQAEQHAAKVEHLKQSPDGVITLLAQEAQDVSDDKASKAQRIALQASKGPSAESKHEAPSEQGTRKDTHEAQGNPARKDSASSVQTIHPEEAVPVSIEARQGWSEIVSKMSSLTGDIGTELKARAQDLKSVSSPQRESQQEKAEETQIRKQEHEKAKTASQQNGSAKVRTDSDLKIVARSSSLAESDRSSTASKSVYASLHPSTHTNGIAPRASSLASATSPAMSRTDALSHPSPPPSVEANNPELVHQLLRRKSDLGERPDVLPDAASDHAVAIKPVASPVDLTPTRELHLREQDPFPLDPTPPSENVGHETSGVVANLMPPGLLKAVGISTSPERKKTVKFDTGSNRPPLKGRFTASLFAGKAEDSQIPLSDLAGTTSGAAKPRPPEEVLARPQPNAIQTPTSSTGSTPASEVQFNDNDFPTHKSVLKKDRMLVKIAWTPHEDVPKDFDELQARKYPIREEDWREFVVVLRMKKLELWTDPSLTSKITGHGDRLKLRTTIPLSTGTTFLSLYSPIDRVFCLTYQPWKSLSFHKARGIHLRRQGTDIVLFDCRARSSAADWMWELFRELGGLIPDSLEVHVPSFGLKIKLPVPETMPVERADPSNTPGSEKGGQLALTSIGKSMDGGEGFKLINRNNIIAMTWKLFCSIPQWHDLMALSRDRGLRLELAWRRGNELDWVINERTVESEPRHWAVLCGALLKDYKHPAILELRAAAHYPTTVQSAPGQYMQEPPAIEGFLWRLKPVSGALTRLYFTTYDGHLYVCRISRAFPPDRHLAVQLQEAMDMRVPRTSSATQGRTAKPSTPATRSALHRALAKFVGADKSARRDEDVATLRQNVLEAISYPAETEEEFQAQIEAYQSFERRRQFEQIRGSDGFIDLKLIHTIKTMGRGPVRCPGEEDLRQPSSAGRAQGDVAAAQRDGEESDEEDDVHANDIGGQEGLGNAEDPNDVRRARQIEITLTNGKKFRVEAFSASVAREWVERITELVKYWRRRERADAVELMYASGIDMGELNKHLQGRKTRTDGFQGVDEERLSPILGNIWNWCAIEGCRNIIRSGRLFHKKSSYSAFKARDYVLIAGRLLCFKLVRSVRTARSRQNNGIFHRRQDTVIHLRDAYVYSGKLSEDMLKNGRSDPAQAVSGIGGGGSNSGKRHRVPRVYADGLFSVDDDEDCTFVIRYRPERVNTPADPGVKSVARKGTTAEMDKSEASETAYSVPTLEDKTHKFIAMRARSKVERDLWVRCIAYEIEKIVRDDVEREKKLKNTGKVDYRKN